MSESPEKQLKTLALFDFDGTITDRDSLPDFIVTAVGLPRFLLGMLLAVALLFPVVQVKMSGSLLFAGSVTYALPR